MLELSQSGDIATLRIHRPERRNAFTTAMWQALLLHCQALQQRPPRVLLLQGEPGAFCAGADIEETARLVADPAQLAHNNSVVSAAQRALAALPLATLAVIDGPCFGGGFGLAASCDFRIGSPRAQFAVTPARLGLLYSLEDTAAVLRLVGDARTRRLLLRGERLDATTALQWGVLDELAEPDALAARCAARVQELAAQSRTAVAGIKATLTALHSGDAVQQAQVRQVYDRAFAGADFAEGAAAFLAKRPPRFL
jgi:enoyl-CoA hydratase